MRMQPRVRDAAAWLARQRVDGPEPVREAMNPKPSKVLAAVKRTEYPDGRVILLVPDNARAN